MKNNILLKVFIGIAFAIIAGIATGTDQTLFGVPYVKMYSLIGQLFLNALHLISVPLVCASIILGTTRMGSESSFGILGAKTFGFYMLSSSLAVLVGISAFFLIFSGVSTNNFVSMDITGHAISSLNIQAQGDAFDTFTQILFKLVPSNILATASGQMLGLICFSILFGFFISKIESSAASVVLKFWEGIFQIMMKITHLIMKALPIGVFGLVAKVVATTGMDAMTSAIWYSLTVIFSLLFYSFTVIPLLLILIGGVNPIQFFRAMSPALFTAFSTSSSAATLPVTMECLEKRVGISNRMCSFAIPLGTSINMSGGAMCMCIASLFIATVYGIPLSLNIICLVALMSLLTSMGIAGIPSAGARFRSLNSQCNWNSS